jgi:DUF971 family protein
MTAAAHDATTPRAIRLDLAQNLLEVDWADGHRSRYDGGYLRFVCPCAGCRGHGPGDVPPPTWEACRDVRIVHAEAVGSYAIRFDFDDRHATGIYSYDLLRAVCPTTLPDADERGRPRPTT